MGASRTGSSVKTFSELLRSVVTTGEIWRPSVAQYNGSISRLHTDDPFL